MKEMTEGKVNKILTENVRWLINIGVVIVSITLGYAFLSTQIAVLQSRVDTIQNNHLVHLQAAVDKLSDRLLEHIEGK